MPYRIIEKKGEWKEETINVRCYEHFGVRYGHGCYCKEIKQNIYTPKYIVQEYQDNKGNPLQTTYWKDLETFIDLDKAREYKREMQLEEGIVIE